MAHSTHGEGSFYTVPLLPVTDGPPLGTQVLITCLPHAT